MASVLSSVAPVGATPYAAPAVSLRNVQPVGPVESARAPRPVDAGTPPQAVQQQARNEKPVGPPPAFEINVLQDIRARLNDPAPVAGDEPDLAPDEEAPPTRAEGAADPAPRPPVPGTEAEPPHQLDKKV